MNIDTCVYIFYIYIYIMGFYGQIICKYIYNTKQNVSYDKGDPSICDNIAGPPGHYAKSGGYWELGVGEMGRYWSNFSYNLNKYWGSNIQDNVYS